MLQEPLLVIGRVVGIPIVAEVSLLQGHSTFGQSFKQHLQLARSTEQHILNNTRHTLIFTWSEDLQFTAGGTGVRFAARFSNATVALIILMPLTFTGVFLGQ